jgi:hypothetical protein
LKLRIFKRELKRNTGVHLTNIRIRQISDFFGAKNVGKEYRPQLSSNKGLMIHSEAA